MVGVPAASVKLQFIFIAMKSISCWVRLERGPCTFKCHCVIGERKHFRDDVARFATAPAQHLTFEPALHGRHDILPLRRAPDASTVLYIFRCTATASRASRHYRHVAVHQILLDTLANRHLCTINSAKALHAPKLSQAFYVLIDKTKRIVGIKIHYDCGNYRVWPTFLCTKLEYVEYCYSSVGLSIRALYGADKYKKPHRKWPVVIKIDRPPYLRKYL